MQQEVTTASTSLHILRLEEMRIDAEGDPTWRADCFVFSRSIYSRAVCQSAAEY